MKGAHVYVLLFSGGLAKVGMSATPRRRIAALTAEVARHHGGSLRRAFVSPPLADAGAVERLLHRRLGGVVMGREWYGAAAILSALGLAGANAPGLPANRKRGA